MQSHEKLRSIDPAPVRPFFQDLVDLLEVTLDQTHSAEGTAATVKLEHGSASCLERVCKLLRQEGQSADSSQCRVKLHSRDARTQISGAVVHIMMRLLSVAAHWLAGSTRSAWELVCRFCLPLFSPRVSLLSSKFLVILRTPALWNLSY